MRKGPKLAVIRGIRPPEAFFYDAFEGMEVKFIYISQRPTSYPARLKNLELVNLKIKPKYFFDPSTIFNRGIYNNRSLVEIEGLEKHLKDADVINITDTYYPWCAQAARISEKLGKKLVTIVWETIPHHPATFVPPYSWSVKQVVSYTDLFIVRSRTALRFTDSVGIPRGKIKAIYKGVDLSKFYPSKIDNLRSKTPIKILYVGQLVKTKGIEELLEAFKDLSLEFPSITLLIAGEGALRGKIMEVSQKYPIKYLGFVKYDGLPRVYQEADIFCSPSKDVRFLGVKFGEEVFGFTLMEAQASGLPIVVTRCGGMPEVVGEKNLLVDQGDVDGLLRALKDLILNERKRLYIGKLNRKRAEKLFNLKRQALETEEAILSVV